MASRALSDLLPEVEIRVWNWIRACQARGVEILVYCTYRSPEEQAALYRIGRELPGKIVTNAAAWASWHQYGRACDAVPLRGGKPLWKYDPAAPEWQVFGEEAAKAGLEWAGTWKRFREYVHVQDTGGLSLAEAYKQSQNETTE